MKFSKFNSSLFYIFSPVCFLVISQNFRQDYIINFEVAECFRPRGTSTNLNYILNLTFRVTSASFRQTNNDEIIPLFKLIVRG